MKVYLIKGYSRAVFVTAIIGVITVSILIPVWGAEEKKETGIRIKRIHICKGIQTREPVDIGDSFPEDVKQLFCFTDVRGAGEETFITHNWYHEDELKASVKLKVAGTHWRTWSSKWIDPTWTGDWRVEIKDAHGRKIASISFSVGEAVQEEATGSEG